jgi:flavodoxin
LARSLVVYYSLEGNTRFVAGVLAAASGADILELNVLACAPRGFKKYFWGGRQVVMKERPALAPFDKDPAAYDLIWIGTPVWAFSFSPAIRTFFSQIPLRGKKIALFCCSGGGPGPTLSHMEKELAGNIIMGCKHFVEPLRDTDKNASAARAWAADVMHAVDPSS